MLLFLFTGSQHRLSSTAESVNSRSLPPANDPRYLTNHRILLFIEDAVCSSPRDITIDVKVEAEAQSQLRQSPERGSSRRLKSFNDHSTDSQATANGHTSDLLIEAVSKDDSSKSGSTVIRRESSKKLTDKIPLISVIRRESSKTSKDMKKLPITTEKYHQAMADLGPKPAMIDDSVTDSGSPKISKYKPRDLHSSNDTVTTDHSSVEVDLAASLASLGNGAAVKPHQSSSSDLPPVFSPTSTTDGPLVSKELVATSSVSDINDLERYLDESDDDLDEVVELTKPVNAKKGRKKSNSLSKKSPKSRHFSGISDSSDQSVSNATIRPEPIKVSHCS